ncbi:hypothetical protein [Ectothiorhodospira marina]|uniref:Carboxypeptidase regulatory-like domain-containing protein n=1 Tax=Ectothiorhodospira marina TaxID=1396821 RepID=A0A1H7K316_9GAMM|nr:hypothetical protein [Ectothiorhodospira marina]SEK80964.1 hypothetical protein SAMN05444515_105111 [Ectothiorhodospira marina]
MSAKVLGVPSVIASAVLLAACGGGGGSSGGDTTTQTATVTGVAAKGLLLGAQVEACADMECREIVAETKTDDDGRYQLRLPVDEHFVIRVRHTEHAQMICDLPQGCGDEVKWGEPGLMPKDITLRSIARVDRTSQEVSAHVTPLTELVMIAAQVSNAGAITPPPEKATENGQEAVLKLLGIEADTPLDLTKLEPVNITKGDHLEAATPEQRNLSVISAAFGRKDETARFISDFAKGFFSETTQDDINKLQEAVDSLNNKTEQQAKINPTATSDIPLTPVTDSQRSQLSQNAIAVRNLVEDIRTVGIDIYKQYDEADLRNTGLLGQIQGIEDFAQDAILWNFEALARVNDAISNGLIEEYANDPECALQCSDTPNSVDLQTDLGADNDISGTLTRVGDRWTLDNGRLSTLDGDPIDVTVEFTVPKVLGENQFAFEILSAKAQGLGAQVELSDARLSVVADQPFTQDQLRDDIPVEGDGNFLRRLELAGTLKLQYTDNEQILAFEGSTKFLAATNNNMIEDNRGNPELDGDTLLPVSFRLDGRFDNGVLGDYLKAEVLVTLDNANEYSLVQNQGAASSEGTGDRFPLATMQVKTAGRITENLPEMDILFRLQRTGEEDAKASITLGWNGYNDQTARRFLTLEMAYSGDTEDLGLMATNASGATFELLPRNQYASNDVVGYVFMDGARHATIREERSNVFTITYHFDEEGNRSTKEAFETLF